MRVSLPPGDAALYMPDNCFVNMTLGFLQVYGKNTGTSHSGTYTHRQCVWTPSENQPPAPDGLPRDWGKYIAAGDIDVHAPYETVHGGGMGIAMGGLDAKGNPIPMQFIGFYNPISRQGVMSLNSGPFYGLKASRVLVEKKGFFGRTTKVPFEHDTTSIRWLFREIMKAGEAGIFAEVSALWEQAQPNQAGSSRL